jgi:hypothetical protein
MMRRRMRRRKRKTTMSHLVSNVPGFGESNDLSCFEDLCPKIALVFFPFHTSMVTFDTLDQLLDGFNAHMLHHRVSFLNAHGPFDRADFFVGNRRETSLANVQRFFNYNEWDNDRIWNFDVVVMVGYNSGTNVIVDVPAAVFPWCIDFYGVSGSNILDQPLLQLVDDHVLTAACQACYDGARRCSLGRMTNCEKCFGGTCKPQINKELDNLRAHYFEALMKERSTLCPSFQYLIACCGTRYGYNKAFTSNDKCILGKIFETAVEGRDLAKEMFIRDKCSAYQLVVYENGALKTVETREIGDRLGFRNYVASKKGKTAMRIVMPCFGISDPRRSFSFFNAAMNKPGEVFVADFNVWDKKLNATVVRMMIMAQFESVDKIYVMVGWV